MPRNPNLVSARGTMLGPLDPDFVHDYEDGPNQPIPPLQADLAALKPDPVVGAVEALLGALGVDEEDHTLETPARVAKAWRHMLAGYAEDPAIHLRKTFSAPGNPGLVVVTGIRLTSTCAHHLLPITGTATVAYRPRPGQQVVGLSKLARLVEGYARRLQVQERIGNQVVTAIQEALDPMGAACYISAEHGCMTLRGVQQHGAQTLTVAVSGEWLVTGHPDLPEVSGAHHRASMV
jgi:GTP cyclohydrolase I